MKVSDADKRDALVLWGYHRLPTRPVPADVIVALGSYDLSVAEYGASLFVQGFAPMAVCSGALGNYTAGRFDRLEADLFADVMRERGVPPSNLLRECRSTNLGENVRFTRQLLAVRAIDTIMLVTKPNTMRRVEATVARQWPEIDATVVAPAIALADQASNTIGWHDLICEMVGDVQRMVEYPQRGFQAPRRVPGEVLQAAAALRERGYSNHLPAPAPRLPK